MTLLTDARFLDREPPAAAKAAPFSPPPCQRFDLDNGLQVFLVENHTVPVITMSWLAKAGSQYDPAGREGLASLVTPLLLEGTKHRRAGQLVEAMDSLGSRILTGFDWDGAFLTYDMLQDDLDPALELLTEIALFPAFPSPTVESWRRRRLIELQRRLQEPVTLLEDAFVRTVYDGGVYGRSFFGNEVSLRSINREDLLDFHAAYFGPAGASVIAVGSFNSEDLLRRLQDLFAREPYRSLPANAPRQKPPLSATEPSTLPAHRVVLVDQPGAAQTWLCIGHAGVPGRHPDFARLEVLNAILGDMYTSRLNLELRERLGLTYEVRSRFVQRGGTGPFTVRAAVGHGNVAAAVRGILHQIERLQQEPVSVAELEDAKTYLSGKMPQRFQTSSWVLKELHRLALYDFDVGYFEHSLEDICNVDAQCLMDLARLHLHSDRLAIVAVGPAEEIYEQLEPWSSGDNKFEVTDLQFNLVSTSLKEC